MDPRIDGDSFDAEWRFDEHSGDGSAFHEKVLHEVRAGEEITVHYGDAYWKWVERRFGITGQCDSCHIL